MPNTLQLQVISSVALSRKHFKNSKSDDGSNKYMKIIDLFHEVTYQTELGQLLDLTTQPLPPAIPDLKKLNMLGNLNGITLQKVLKN